MAERAIIRHTLTMFEALYKESSLEDIEGETTRIFRGKVTDVFRSTGIGQSYYSEIFRQLQGQGCLTILERGSKAFNSTIVLHYPPTRETTLPARKSVLTDAERYANLREDVEALKTLVGGVSIVEALRSIEERLGQLEVALSHNKNDN